MSTKKTAIVTGATGAIGTAIARQVLATGNFKVIMAIKDSVKADLVIQQIKDDTGQDDIIYMVVDLARKEQVFELAARIKWPVHALVNNAACTPRQRMETPEGIEMQWATNVLGYYWMIQAFEKSLRAGAPSRVVNVASYWAGSLDLHDVEFKRRSYHNNTAYMQSKQANRMLTVAFSERLAPYGITVNSCHPGDVNSQLSNNLGFGGFETPDQGASTPAWLATSPEVEGVTGKYFANRRESACEFSRDRKAIAALLNQCELY